jgi:DNA-binding transcriptional LysR family regulator
MDLNLLVVFEALMDERSVTRAAKRVGLSQPAVSNALARLRRTFDDPLFVRAPDGMRPTPAAQSLIAPVRAALAQLRAVFEEPPTFAPALSERSFNLLTSDYAEITLLAALTQKLRAEAAGVRLRSHRAPSVFEPPTPQALAETYDFAVGFFPDQLTLDASVHARLLWEEKNVCIVRKNHPTVRGKISLRQYAEAGHAAIFYKPQGAGVIDTLLAQKGHARRTAVVVPHFTSVPFIVAASDLIATVPERLALKFAGPLRLQVLGAPLAIPPFRLTLLWHERFTSDPAHRWLRELIAETART